MNFHIEYHKYAAVPRDRLGTLPAAPAMTGHLP